MPQSSLVRPPLALWVLNTDDRANMVAVWAANANRMWRWSSIPADITEKVDSRLARAQDGLRRGTRYCFGFHLGRMGPYFGDVTLYDVTAGSGSIGYWIAERYEGLGYAADAVGLGLAFAFRGLGLRSIRADVEPDNNRSLKFLRGFEFQPTPRRCTHPINGSDRYHDVFILTRERWTQAHPSVAYAVPTGAGPGILPGMGPALPLVLNRGPGWNPGARSRGGAGAARAESARQEMGMQASRRSHRRSGPRHV